MPAKIDSGMEVETISVFRQLPRNNRIINETRMDEITASRTTLVDRGTHEHRLVEIELDLQPVRGRRLDLRQHGPGCIHHRQRRGIGMLQDGQIDGTLAIDMHDVVLHRETVGHVRHIADADGHSVEHSERNRVEPVHHRRGWN